jgi:hypothetical protein
MTTKVRAIPTAKEENAVWDIRILTRRGIVEWGRSDAGRGCKWKTVEEVVEPRSVTRVNYLQKRTDLEDV